MGIVLGQYVMDIFPSVNGFVMYILHVTYCRCIYVDFGHLW